ncbi:putative 3-hydroxyisobutyrate dehydrogenase, mitochondrial [Glarea lozoyensis 74030]|uniref:3-hydroxyisobutyrate dehydrogenase n=1 Tax=Glarea lozoyensis (strain ATCC 74030 / MF5533) TaxID=1104152 RepID=H0EFT0_GLAL7|nr:putative 3-hydroxyisobutyrate dehydrogenase, mitochondrial [Glarea lozoyensis 74030]
MAKNLQAKLPPSDTLRIYDINTESVNQFASEAKASSGGAAVQVASNVHEAAEDSETTITVLPEPSHVKNVFAQILKPPLSTDAVANPDRLFIDCSTIDPASSKEVANAVHATQQGRFVDAPMSAEAMNLGIRWGLDPKVLGNLINISTGKCWPSEVNNPVKGVVDGSPASRDYSGGFGISLMKKDLKLALLAASEAGARLELGDKAREVYEAAEQKEDCKGRDFSVVYRYLGGKE